eukprot:1846274-Pyramimonas_sp.AAC.2
MLLCIATGQALLGSLAWADFVAQLFVTDAFHCQVLGVPGIASRGGATSRAKHQPIDRGSRPPP